MSSKRHTDKILIYYFVGISQGKIEASSLQENIQWHIKNVKNIKAFNPIMPAIALTVKYIVVYKRL